MSRLEQLRAMLKAEPDDVFLNFGVAMELVKVANFDDALAAFDQVIRLDGDFPPGFFQKARALAQIDRIDDARRALDEGIEAARRAGDSHAEGEMSEMLASLA